VECKLRYVSFSRVSDPRRAFLQAFRVTGRVNDKPESTRERRQQVSEHLESHVSCLPQNVVVQNSDGGSGNDIYDLSFNNF
jgi:hypothetical protein